MNVARNVMLDPRLVPGGGAAEMALAHVSTFPDEKLLLLKSCDRDIALFFFLFNLQYTCGSVQCSPILPIAKVAVPSKN